MAAIRRNNRSTMLAALAASTAQMRAAGHTTCSAMTEPRARKAKSHHLGNTRRNLPPQFNVANPAASPGEYIGIALNALAARRYAGASHAASIMFAEVAHFSGGSADNEVWWVRNGERQLALKTPRSPPIFKSSMAKCIRCDTICGHGTVGGIRHGQEYNRSLL